MSYCVAIVLAAGRGSRMGQAVPKQFLEIDGKPIICYSLKRMEESFVDEIILVTGESDLTYCENEIVKRYGFRKVSKVVAGGKERYHSVYNGLKAIKQCDYVLIHDGARPFLTEEILKRNLEAVEEYKACVTGMPVKDTIKISDAEGFVDKTPGREFLWQIQTPQTFEYRIIKTSYDAMFEQLMSGTSECAVTDDAMVVEQFGGVPVKLVKGDYTNIKITTPEDLFFAEEYLKRL